MDRPRQSRDVVDLPGRVVHAGQHRHGEAMPVGVDGRLEDLWLQDRSARGRCDDDQVAGRIQAAQS
jgi:hypothetical protein